MGRRRGVQPDQHWSISDSNIAPLDLAMRPMFCMVLNILTQFPFRQHGPPITHFYIAPLFVKTMAQKQGLRCVLISDPCTLGAGAKHVSNLARMKKFTAHCVCSQGKCGVNVFILESRRQGAGAKTHLKSRFCAILTKFTPHCVCRRGRGRGR